MRRAHLSDGGEGAATGTPASMRARLPASGPTGVHAEVRQRPNEGCASRRAGGDSAPEPDRLSAVWKASSTWWCGREAL